MATLIPYSPLAVTERWSWRTGLLKMWGGLEQRIAYLQNPRRSWAVDLAVDDERDRRDVRLALFQDPVSPWDLPLAHESEPTQNEVTGTTATIDSTYTDWVAVGQSVYIVGPDPGDAYQTTIDSLGGTTGARVLTLDDTAPAGRFPAGLTRVMPVVSVLLGDGQTATRAAPAVRVADDGQEDVGAGAWRLQAVAAEYSTTFGTGATVATFDGYPVFDRRPVIEADPEERALAELRRFDEGAAVEQTWSKSFADLQRGHSFVLEDRPERQWLKKFLGTVYGRQKAFLLPTWRHDFDLDSQPAGGTTITLQRTPGYQAWFASAGHKHLQLLKADGSVEYCKATAVVDNGDGTEDVTVSSTVGAGTVERVSLLELARLGEDDVDCSVLGDRRELALRFLVVQR